MRLAASSGSNTDASRFRCEVPEIRAPNRSADAATPTAVLRPSSATAMPKNPIWVIWMSFVATRNCQPSTSSEPARPAKAPQTAITST